MWVGFARDAITFGTALQEGVLSCSHQQAEGAGAGSPSLPEAAGAPDDAPGAPVVPAGPWGEDSAPQTIALFTLAVLSGELTS